VSRKKLAASDYILKIPVREIRECTSALKCSKSGDFGVLFYPPWYVTKGPSSSSAAGLISGRNASGFGGVELWINCE
jgi:hypothetical protein